MSHTRLTAPSYLSDLFVLLARLVLGTVLVAHGWQKFSAAGPTGPVNMFAGMGMPMPEIAAPVAMYVELVGGALLILGLFTAPVGLLVAIQMTVAAVMAHLPGGVFVDNGGWELVGVIAAAALMLAAFGPGRLALDPLILPARTRRRKD